MARTAVSDEDICRETTRAAVARQQRSERKKRTARAWASAAALTVGAVLAGAPPASAGSIVVLNTNDAGAGSLRQAVIQANGTAGPDDITFDPGVFGTPQTISLLTGELTVTEALTITGTGATNLTIQRNFAAPASRIITISAGPVTITGVRLTGGNAPSSGGGAILTAAAPLTVVNSVLTENQAVGATAGDGGAILGTGAGAALTIVGSTLSENTATGEGGAIWADTGVPVTIQRSRIHGNTAAVDAGGVYCRDANPLTIEESTISGNMAQDAAANGGGVFHSGTATVVIRGSAIWGNSALGAAADGGGFYTTGGTPDITIENSTFAGNTAGRSGGAIIRDATGTGTMSVRHSTITLNTASGASGSGGGGMFIANTFTGLTIRNTIVSDNTNVNTADLSAGIVNVNFSAIGTAFGWTPSGTSGNNLPPGTNLQLGPLQDNGGPTATHEPGPNAPPVNAGDPAFAPPPSFDQRGAGFARVVGGVIDIGSLERNPVPVEAMTFAIE